MVTKASGKFKAVLFKEKHNCHLDIWLHESGMTAEKCKNLVLARRKSHNDCKSKYFAWDAHESSKNECACCYENPDSYPDSGYALYKIEEE